MSRVKFDTSISLGTIIHAVLLIGTLVGIYIGIVRKQAIIDEKLSSLPEIKEDMKGIKSDMVGLKIDVAILKSKPHSGITITNFSN